ncbi:hypothetical protein B0T22DRAFT_112477 [Podospora appendiculata]|uniref:Uncharacterized protein n=1 Tax=Podospora appendiculata TaxID=314037 RepID=A0AAE1CII3_9PEZI|nr:hypothetical protein B0T22DRAFT_112477 [Podospora appendiculata]
MRRRGCIFFRVFLFSHARLQDMPVYRNIFQVLLTGHSGSSRCILLGHCTDDEPDGIGYWPPQRSGRSWFCSLCTIFKVPIRRWQNRGLEGDHAIPFPLFLVCLVLFGDLNSSPGAFVHPLKPTAPPAHRHHLTPIDFEWLIVPRQ